MGEGHGPRAGSWGMLRRCVAGYLPNGGVVMPAFGNAEADARAEADMRRLFPDRAVVPVPPPPYHRPNPRTALARPKPNPPSPTRVTPLRALHSRICRTAIPWICPSCPAGY
jgi:hypothetical protein